MPAFRALVLVAALFAVAQPATAQVDITLIDVGQGDSILVTFPPLADGTRRRMLIDGGVSTSNNAPVVRFLQSQGIQELDWVVLSHPHVDHFGGLIPVLNQFTVREVWTNNESRTCPANPQTRCDWRDFVNARANATHIVPTQGMTRTSSRAKVEVLMVGGMHPDNGGGDDINNDSLSLMLTYKGRKALFTGDIEEDGGLDLVNRYCSPTRDTCGKLNSDIIKIPHHGSDHLSPRFVELAAAEMVLISAGFRNEAFHHPRTEALQAYVDLVSDPDRRPEFFSTSANRDRDDHITVTIAANGEIVPPTFQAGQTYTAWSELDDGSVCASGITHDTDPDGNPRYCLVLVPQGQAPQ
jgi:competence protein ComEC